MPITRQDIEKALDKGQLWVLTSGGNYWRLRRNGKTKTWKRDPDRFHIPVKAGFKDTGKLDQDSEVGHDHGSPVLISETDPNDSPK